MTMYPNGVKVCVDATGATVTDDGTGRILVVCTANVVATVIVEVST